MYGRTSASGPIGGATQAVHAEDAWIRLKQKREVEHGPQLCLGPLYRQLGLRSRPKCGNNHRTVIRWIPLGQHVEDPEVALGPISSDSTDRLDECVSDLADHAIGNHERLVRSFD
ncbi:MAG TPA: hypothetical protein VIM73_14305, partial [Polyangiaceae bacterium]